MAFTDDCDLYAAVHEEGINRVIRHVMLQRPSLFNYATADVVANRELWCRWVEHTKDVTKYGNPLFTVMPPLPVLGTSAPPVTVGFCVQVTKAEIDFHPGNVFALPPELSPPLAAQRFALHFEACAAVACPSDREVEQIPVLTFTNVPGTHEVPPSPPVQVRGQLNCFCLEVFVVGHFTRAFLAGTERLLGKVDGIEIVDIRPDALEANIECYLKTAVTLVLRQKLAIPLETFFVDFPLFGTTVSLFPTPNPPIPNNPAVEDDQLKAFVTMSVGP